MAQQCEARLILRFIDALIEAGAVIFGGAPRDILLAKHHATAYYAAGGTDRDFDDVAGTLPQFAARVLLPTDIDAHISEDDFALMDGLWSRFQMQSSRRMCVDPYLMVPNNATHYRYTLGIAKREYFDRDLMLACIHPDMRALFADCVGRFTREMASRSERCRRQFNLDLIVLPRGASLLTSQPDFDVNGLCMDERGMHLSPALATALSSLDRHVRFQEILEAIHAKRATFLGWKDASNARLIKMLGKGWTVPLTLVCEEVGPYDGHCIACHERFGDNEMHYKLPCCDARYHATCLDASAKQMVRKAKCILCNRAVDAKALFIDTFVLQPLESLEMRPFPEPEDADYADMPDLIDDTD